MYKSKKQIENKIKQVSFLNNEIQKFRGRIFINYGIDPETGADPLLTHVTSFLALSRSVLQYAHKEAIESKYQIDYENYVKDINIFILFKELRNSDIHEFTIEMCQIMFADAPLNQKNMKNNVIKSKPITMVVEKLEDLNNPPKEKGDVTTVYTLRKKVDITN